MFSLTKMHRSAPKSEVFLSDTNSCSWTAERDNNASATHDIHDVHVADCGLNINRTDKASADLHSRHNYFMTCVRGAPKYAAQHTLGDTLDTKSPRSAECGSDSPSSAETQSSPTGSETAQERSGKDFECQESRVKCDGFFYDNRTSDHSETQCCGEDKCNSKWPINTCIRPTSLPLLTQDVSSDFDVSSSDPSSPEEFFDAPVEPASPAGSVVARLKCQEHDEDPDEFKDALDSETKINEIYFPNKDSDFSGIGNGELASELTSEKSDLFSTNGVISQSENISDSAKRENAYVQGNKKPSTDHEVSDAEAAQTQTEELRPSNTNEPVNGIFIVTSAKKLADSNGGATSSTVDCDTIGSKPSMLDQSQHTSGRKENVKTFEEIPHKLSKMDDVKFVKRFAKDIQGSNAGSTEDAGPGRPDWPPNPSHQENRTRKGDQFFGDLKPSGFRLREKWVPSNEHCESSLNEETRKIVKMLENDKVCRVPRLNVGLQDRLQSLMQRSGNKKVTNNKGPRFCSTLVKTIVKRTTERIESNTDSFEKFKLRKEMNAANQTVYSGEQTRDLNHISNSVADQQIESSNSVCKEKETSVSTNTLQNSDVFTGQNSYPLPVRSWSPCRLPLSSTNNNLDIKQPTYTMPQNNDVLNVTDLGSDPYEHIPHSNSAKTTDFASMDLDSSSSLQMDICGQSGKQTEYKNCCDQSIAIDESENYQSCPISTNAKVSNTIEKEKVSHSTQNGELSVSTSPGEKNCESSEYNRYSCILQATEALGSCNEVNAHSKGRNNIKKICDITNIQILSEQQNDINSPIIVEQATKGNVESTLVSKTLEPGPLKKTTSQSDIDDLNHQSQSGMDDLDYFAPNDSSASAMQSTVADAINFSESSTNLVNTESPSLNAHISSVNDFPAKTKSTISLNGDSFYRSQWTEGNTEKFCNNKQSEGNGNDFSRSPQALNSHKKDVKQKPKINETKHQQKNSNKHIDLKQHIASLNKVSSKLMQKVKDQRPEQNDYRASLTPSLKAAFTQSVTSPPAKAQRPGLKKEKRKVKTKDLSQKPSQTDSQCSNSPTKSSDEDMSQDKNEVMEQQYQDSMPLSEDESSLVKEFSMTNSRPYSSESLYNASELSQREVEPEVPMVLETTVTTASSNLSQDIDVLPKETKIIMPITKTINGETQCLNKEPYSMPDTTPSDPRAFPPQTAQPSTQALTALESTASTLPTNTKVQMSSKHTEGQSSSSNTPSSPTLKWRNVLEDSEDLSDSFRRRNFNFSSEINPDVKDPQKRWNETAIMQLKAKNMVLRHCSNSTFPLPARRDTARKLFTQSSKPVPVKETRPNPTKASQEVPDEVSQGKRRSSLIEEKRNSTHKVRRMQNTKQENVENIEPVATATNQSNITELMHPRNKENMLEELLPLPPGTQQSKLEQEETNTQQSIPHSRRGSREAVLRSRQGSLTESCRDSRRGSWDRRGSGSSLNSRRGSIEKSHNISRRGTKTNFSENLLRKCLEVAIDKCEQEDELMDEKMPMAEVPMMSCGHLDKALSRAVARKNVEKVRDLLAHGANPNTSSGQLPALLRASKEGALYVVQALISAGADVDARSDQGNSALHEAARVGHNEVVIHLVYSNAYVDAINRNGVTPLQTALSYGQVEVVQTLMRFNADIHLQNKVGESALTLAQQLGYVGLTGTILEVRRDSGPGTRAEIIQMEIPVTVQMILGLEEGCPLTIEDCLARGANCNSIVPLALHWPAYATVLHRAAHHGHDLIARLLLQAGADVNARDVVGNTPLHAAAQAGHNRVVKVLLANGALLEATSRSGMTPLHRAASKGKELTCNLLVRRGANIRTEDNDGRTPADWAIRRGFKSVARKLGFRRRSSSALLAEQQHKTCLKYLDDLYQASQSDSSRHLDLEEI